MMWYHRRSPCNLLSNEQNEVNVLGLRLSGSDRVRVEDRDPAERRAARTPARVGVVVY